MSAAMHLWDSVANAMDSKSVFFRPVLLVMRNIPVLNRNGQGHVPYA